MKIAIVHDWLSTYGGSERVLAEALALYPHADLFALIHNPKNFRGTPIEGLKVKTTFLQNFPRVEKLYRALLPFMPFAIESLDLHNYNLILSFSHAVAHGVKTTSAQTHVSYISTPMRYAWHLQNDYLHLHRLDKPLLGAAARGTLEMLRRWDRSVAKRANYLLANSHWTAGNIRAAWGRESHTIYPPVKINRFAPAKERDDFYLHVARLVPYKMTAEIIRAFNELNLPLIIVGDGPEMPRLQKLAKDNIKLLGYQTDEVVTDLMNRARAFVYMAVEDFGIAMVEAQAAGCPVVAYGKGGAQEIVLDGETGLLFQEQTAGSMIEAVLNSRKTELNNKAASGNAARFSSKRFRDEFSTFMETVISSSRFRVPSLEQQLK